MKFDLNIEERVGSRRPAVLAQSRMVAGTGWDPRGWRAWELTGYLVMWVSTLRK